MTELDKFYATLHEIVAKERTGSERYLLGVMERCQEMDSRLLQMGRDIEHVKAVMQSAAWKSLVRQAEEASK